MGVMQENELRQDRKTNPEDTLVAAEKRAAARQAELDYQAAGRLPLTGYDKVWFAAALVFFFSFAAGLGAIAGSAFASKPPAVWVVSPLVLMVLSGLTWVVFALIGHHVRLRQIWAGPQIKEPVPFEIYLPGVYLYGTRKVLQTGDTVDSGVQITETLDAATWDAELGGGTDRGHIYLIEPVGRLDDAEHFTAENLTGNPTRSYITTQPARITGEIVPWLSHGSTAVRRVRDHQLLKQQTTVMS